MPIGNTNLMRVNLKPDEKIKLASKAEKAKKTLPDYAAEVLRKDLRSNNGRR